MREDDYRQLLDEEKYPNPYLIPKEIGPFFHVSPYTINVWARDGYDCGVKLIRSGRNVKCWKKDLYLFLKDKQTMEA